MLDFPKQYAETDGKYFVQVVLRIVTQGRQRGLALAFNSQGVQGSDIKQKI